MPTSPRNDYNRPSPSAGGPDALPLCPDDVPSRLRKEILARSVAGAWDAARQEWVLSDVFSLDSPGRCLCGHRPISECCVLTNQLNGNEVVVGNVCVEQFIGLPSERLFAAFRRISADRGAALSASAIEFSRDQGWLNEWEVTFCLNTRQKRRLTDRQLAKRRQINEKVLARFLRGGGGNA